MTNETRMLLQPIQVGPLRLKNRMVKSPMLTGLASASGEVTDQLIEYYRNIAKGGVSMIVVEIAAITERYAFLASQLRIDEMRFQRGLRRLVEAIHLNGVHCEIQIHCAGAFGKESISPSGVPCYGIGRVHFVQPRVLSLPEVEQIRDLFIAAAVRAKELESDGVVLHGATSYLLQQWVSPHTNLRTDRYGGSFENRIALPLEIVRGVRQKCGSSFTIGYSMVIDELLPDGIHMDEAVAFARALENEGVDHIDLMVGTYETSTTEKGIGRSNRQPKGLFERSGEFKKSINTKVFARSYGEHDPAKWEEALVKGQCDVIMVGRPLLCDPELPRKVSEGRPEDVRFCIRCNHCYETGVIKPFQVACALNASAGKEKDYAITRITCPPKRVLVIGGGPAGLETARVAALRGHEVTILEKEGKLGGTARIAALPIGKQDIQTNLIDWLERQCQKAGVKVELNKKATTSLVTQMKPDVVIVATGAAPLIPRIPGIDKKHVVTAADILSLKVHPGKRVVVAGGGLVGIETADFIAEKGLAEKVTIVEMLPSLGTDMPAMQKPYLIDYLLPKYGVRTVTGMKIVEITDEAVVALDKNWKESRFEADTVINATGYVADPTLGEALVGKVPELYRIGDCVKARNILAAIHEAAYVARQF